MPNIIVTLAGSTGLVGSHILKNLLSNPSINTVHAFSRRALDTSTASAKTNADTNPDNSTTTNSTTTATATAKLHPIISTDTSSWPASFPPSTQLYITALGSTRANAGSFQAQRAIDVDLNVALARAATATATPTPTTSAAKVSAAASTTEDKTECNPETEKATTSGATSGNAGAKVCVVISSAGASPGSMMPYSDMKGTLDKEVSEMGFEKVVIVRPGLIVGERQEGRAVEGSLRALAKGLGAISGGHLKDFWAQDADVIARAAVTAGVMAVEGKAPTDKKVWVVDQKEILRLGKNAAACTI